MEAVTKVFVGNLAFSTKESELAQAFENIGAKVSNANIITRGSRSLGYGFVEFSSESDAKKAVEKLHKTELGGRSINVELAKPRERLNEENGNEDSPKQEGEFRTQRRGYGSRGGFRRGYGNRGGQYRSSKPGFQRSFGNNNTKFSGNRRYYRRNDSNRSGYQRPRRTTDLSTRVESEKTLYVSNFPFKLSEEGFKKLLTDEKLNFISLRIVTGRNGYSKGFGFIEFENKEDQKKALTALSNKQVDGRELNVKIALVEPEQTEGKSTPEVEKKEEKSKDEKPLPKDEKKATTTPAPKETAPSKDEKKSTPTFEKKKESSTPKGKGTERK